MKRSVLALSLVLSISYAGLRPAAAQVVYEVDPIVVTAERVSQKARDALSSLTVITRREIEALQAEDLGEILRLVPGLQVQQYGSYGNMSQVRLRGSESSHLLVMIDGVEVNDPFFGGFDIAHITADQIERIEVVRGTQTSLYGADAIGGVVNVILREGGEGKRLQAGGEAGGYGFRKAFAAMGGSEGRFKYDLNASHVRSKGLNERDEYRNTSVSATAKMYASDNTSASIGLLYTEYYKALPFSFYYDFGDFNYHQYLDPNNSQEGELVNVYAKFSHSWKERFVTSVRGALSYDHLRNYNGADLDPNFSNTSLNTKKLDLLVDERARLATWSSLLLSLQYQDESASRLDDNYYSAFTAVDRRIYTSAFSVSLDLHRGNSLKALLGIRNDNPSLFASRTSPQVRLAWRAQATGTRLRAGWSTGFRVPTLSDLYFPSFGNPDLKPEKANSLEAGVDQELGFLGGLHLGNAALSVVVFDLELTDMIAYNEKTWRTENIAKGRYRGVEVEFTSLLGARGMVRANYTFQKAEGTKFGEEKRFPRRPENTFNLFVAFSPLKELEFSTEYSNVGDQLVALSFVTDAGEAVSAGDRLSGYGIVNLGASYRLPAAAGYLEGSSVYVRLRNVLDERYEEIKGYPAPGRSLILGVKATL
jgi:vitamin B12 transporter